MPPRPIPVPHVRSRPLRLALLSLVGVLLWAGAWTAWVLVSEKGSLEQSRETLTAARADGDLDRATAALAEAQVRLDRSVRRLDQPGPRIIARVPFLGRPVQAAQRTAAAGAAVVTSTRQVLAAADPSQGLLVDGGLDVTALTALGDALEQAAEDTQGPVEQLQDQSTSLLPGFVGSPVNRAQDLLAPVPESFSRAAAGVRGLTAVLGSPTPKRLLIMLENNAELRGTGGLVTVFAEATAQDGRLRISGFRDVEDVAGTPPDVTTVAAPGDYERLWGTFLGNTTLWKNTNMTPDVPTASAVLANVARASLGRAPDAVLWLDVRTIAAVLDATGPATLADGTVLTGANTVDVLLSQAYAGATDTRAGQAQRRNALSGAADAVLDRLLDGGSDPADLGLGLAQAARGRHLALWSATPVVQSQLVRAGLAGGADADGDDLVSFTVQNLGGGDRDGNKLDYYARREVSLDVTVGKERATVVQRITLRNTAPRDGLPRYVAGAVDPGTSRNLITLAVPAGAEDLAFTRAGTSVSDAVRPEGDHRVLTDAATLAPGTSATWEARYTVSVEDGQYSVRLVPQPLAVDATLRVRIRAGSGVALTGAIDRTEPFADGETLRADVDQPGALKRLSNTVRSFWQEPVT